MDQYPWILWISIPNQFQKGLTINEERSGRSVGSFFMHLSTKSLILSEKIFFGNSATGSLTIYSNNSKMDICFVPTGVIGCNETMLLSRSWGPKRCIWLEMSGGGIGYIPKLISNKDNPSDHISLATEYCDP